MIILQKPDGSWQRTWFKSLLSVKRWATKYQHVWRVEGSTVIVSTAEGELHRYKERELGAKPASGKR